MERRIVATGLAILAAVALVGAHGVELVVSPFRSLSDVVPFGLGASISVAIPATGAVLVARRRPAGIAILVTGALIALPAILSAGYFLTSLRGPGNQAAATLLTLAAQLSMVGAGAAAWGLRDADRWRWNRPVPIPFVALGIVVLLPSGAILVSSNGVLFPMAMVASLNVLELAMLVQWLVVVGLLVWGTRLPRRTAAVLLLVLLVPRLHSSTTSLLMRVIDAPGVGGIVPEPLHWLGMAAEAALAGVAVWWLTREEDVQVRGEPADPGTPVRGPTAG